MKAKEFWESFSHQVKENQAELISTWNLHLETNGETAFTRKIKEVIISAIKEKRCDAKIYKERENYTFGDYVLQPEYLKIDLIAWEQKKSGRNEKLFVENGLKRYSFKKHAWNFDIAVEHENDKNHWMDEVIKLAYIFCPLRVVIGYFPYIENRSDKQKMHQNYLNAISDTIKTLNCHNNMKNGEFMIILGDNALNESADFNKIYSPYIWKKNKFVPLK